MKFAQVRWRLLNVDGFQLFFWARNPHEWAIAHGVQWLVSWPPCGILVIPQHFRPEEVKRLNESWKELYPAYAQWGRFGWLHE
jgi:hypothetical protein